MSQPQPDLKKTMAETWEAAKLQATQSLEAGRAAWTTYVDPKARELQTTLKLKMEETHKYLTDKAASFSRQQKWKNLIGFAELVPIGFVFHQNVISAHSALVIQPQIQEG